MKITKIIAAFMVAGFIGIAGCDATVNVEDPTLNYEEAMDPSEMPTDLPA